MSKSKSDFSKAHAARYKKVSVWLADQKKNKTYNIKRADFPNEKELNDYAEKLKAKHRAENKAYREQKQKEKYNLITNATTPTTKQESKPSPSVDNKINVSNKIKLDLNHNTGNTICIFGSSKKGKSTLMMYLYKKIFAQRKEYISTLFSPNIHIGVYKTNKKLLTCNTFNHQAEKYIHLQKYINEKTDNHYKFLNMFDDIIDAKHKQLMNEMIMTYRNSNISTMICLQYGYLLSKMNRANINYSIIFGSNSHESILDLINTFLKQHFIRMGVFDLNDQVKLYKQVTKNHGFILIDNLHDKMTFHRLKL